MSKQNVPFCVRLIDIAKSRPNEIAYKHKIGEEWVGVSWSQYSALVQTAAKAFMALGVKRGERVFLLAETRPEWAILALATQLVGGVLVSAYTSASANTLSSIIQEQLPAVLVTDDAQHWARLKATGSRFSPLKYLVGLNTEIDDRRGLQWEEFLQKASETRSHRLEGRIAQIQFTDVSVVSYLERRTRGVSLTHANEAFAGDSFTRLCKFTSADRILSFMPMANATERALSVYQPINTGCLVYYGGELSKLHENMSAVQPTVVFSAPVLWERFAGVFRSKLGSKDPTTLPSAVRKKLRKFIGCSRLRLGMSTTAGIHEDTLSFYRSLEMNVVSIYTKEALSGICTFCEPEKFALDTVGSAVDGVEMRVDPTSGELLVRGPNVCHSFYGQAPNVANAWFRTGDGAVGSGKNWRVLGKLENRVTLSSGERVFVEPVELQLASSPFVSAALVVPVASKNGLGALLALDREAVKVRRGKH